MRAIIIFLTLFATTAYSQCPDSISVDSTITFYFNNNTGWLNSIQRVEIDTDSTYDLCKISNTNYSITIENRGLQSTDVYTEIRYFTGSGGQRTCTQTKALPVVLMDFRGSSEGNSRKIEWSTAMEWNCHYFEIIKDNKPIGRINCTNTNEATSYIFQDKSIGVNIYELIQVDYDGTTDHLGAIKLGEEYIWEYTLDYGFLEIQYKNKQKTAKIKK